MSKAGATGLEPATSGVTGRRSNQLNYAPGRRTIVAASHLAYASRSSAASGCLNGGITYTPAAFSRHSA